MPKGLVSESFVGEFMLNPRSSHYTPTMTNLKKWLQRYVFTKLHDIFFMELPTVLAKWLLRLDEKNRKF
jgi:hypothetical protein